MTLFYKLWLSCLIAYLPFNIFTFMFDGLHAGMVTLAFGMMAFPLVAFIERMYNVSKWAFGNE